MRISQPRSSKRRAATDSKAGGTAAVSSIGNPAPLDIQQAVLEAMPTGVYLCAADGTVVGFNRRACELWGRTPRPGDTDERFCGSFRLYDPRGRHMPHDRTPMEAALRTGEPQRDKEVVIERPDGSRIVVLVNIEPLKGDDGRIKGAINCFQDISERKLVEAALARRMEEQTTLYRFTDRLQHADAPEAVYEAALDAILAGLRCQRASILLFDAAGVMRFVAWRGLSEGYRRAVDGHSPWTPESLDPRPICVDDLGAADLDPALRQTIAAEGIGALAFVPLVTDHRLVGKFMTYYDAPHHFTEGEVELAVAIGRHLGFAVERMRAEAELRRSEARERANAAELRTIMDTTPAVMFIARDPECRVIEGNRAAYAFLRRPLESNISLSASEMERPTNFEVLVDGRVLPPEELPVQRAARGETVHDFEEECRFEDGTSRVLLGNAVPLRDGDGRPRGAVSAFVDITDRKKAEAQRDLMVAELSHRVKNTLAVVISIARQSFAKNPDVAAASRAFEARIRALAQTHSRLAEANWGGISLQAILADELAPYRRDNGGNVTTGGPPVTINPRCALTLGMTIHELATNAAKYGALSAKAGKVDVAWTVDSADAQLRIRWRESGGPQVAVPTHSGFGRLLLERALAADLGGQVALDFAPAGVSCAIAIPLDGHVVAADDARP